MRERNYLSESPVETPEHQPIADRADIGPMQSRLQRLYRQADSAQGNVERLRMCMKNLRGEQSAQPVPQKSVGSAPLGGYMSDMCFAINTIEDYNEEISDLIKELEGLVQ